MSEEQARKQGWVPQAEWKGEPEKWTDADTFVERGEKIAGIATKRNRKLEDEIDTLTAQMTELQTSNAEFGEFHTQTVAKMRKDRESAIQAMREEKATAISEGDGGKVLKIEDDIKALEQQPVASGGSQNDWARENTWYATDKTLKTFADGVANRLRQEGNTQEGKAFLDEVAKETKATFPDKFKNPKRTETVTTGGSQTDETGSAVDKTFEALPADAQAACDRFVKSGIFKSREAYVRTYEWE